MIEQLASSFSNAKGRLALSARAPRASLNFQLNVVKMRFSQAQSLLLITTLASLVTIVSSISLANADGPENGSGSNKHVQKVKPGDTLTGKATLYPNFLDGETTANGETFHQSRHTAASNKLPLGTDVKVTNLKNGKTTKVTTTDHGPALGNHKIDLSKRAAEDIGLSRKQGTVPVKIKVTRTPNNGTSR